MIPRVEVVDSEWEEESAHATVGRWEFEKNRRAGDEVSSRQPPATSQSLNGQPLPCLPAQKLRALITRPSAEPQKKAVTHRPPDGKYHGPTSGIEKSIQHAR